jgi:hypothetical protein
MEKTIFHELYGHAATATLFGGVWYAKHNALLKTIGGGAGLYRRSSRDYIHKSCQPFRYRRCQNLA